MIRYQLYSFTWKTQQFLYPSQLLVKGTRDKKKQINKGTDTKVTLINSFKKETGHERTKDKSTSKKNCEIIPTSCPSTHTLTWINHPCLSHPPNPPIIHHKITIDTWFLVQMRQSNKCGSVRNYEIFNLGLQSGVGPWVSIPCLLQNTSYIYSIRPNH